VGHQVGSRYHYLNQKDIIRVNKTGMGYMNTLSHHNSVDSAGRLRAYLQNYKELKTLLVDKRKRESLQIQRELSLNSLTSKKDLTREERRLLQIPNYLLSDEDQVEAEALRGRLKAPLLSVTLVNGLSVSVKKKEVVIERIDNDDFLATLHITGPSGESILIPLTLLQSLRLLNDSSELRQSAEKASITESLSCIVALIKKTEEEAGLGGEIFSF